MNTLFQNIPATEGVRKVGPGEGEKFDIAGAHVTWKVKGDEEWIRCETGGLMILPPNSLHAFYNKTSEPCRLLGISTPSHQAFFDAVVRTDKSQPFESLQFPEAMRLVAQIGAQHNFYFAPVDVSKPAGQR